MVVAKRQTREKPAKIEQRKFPGPECEPQVKQTALLASSIYTGQTQVEEKNTLKKGAKLGWGHFFSSRLLGQPTLRPRG